MRRSIQFVSIGVAALLVAWVAPTQAMAACPTGGTDVVKQCQFALGCGYFLDAGASAAATAGGDFFFLGVGDDALGTGAAGEVGFGDDAGGKAARVMPVTGAPGSPFPYDDLLGGFGPAPNTSRLFNWDMGSLGSDGCSNGLGGVIIAVVTNSENKAALASVASVPTAAGQAWEFDLVNNGLGDIVLASGPKVAEMTRAVVVTSSTDNAGGTVDVTVAPYTPVAGAPLAPCPAGAQCYFDDVGGSRPIFAPAGPIAVDLVTKPAGSANNVPGGGSIISAGMVGGGPFTVTETDLLCWQGTDTSSVAPYTFELGCVEIGVPNAAQEILSPTVRRRGRTATFSWSVVQSTVAGFNIYKEDVTRGTKRKLNDGLIYAGDNNFNLQDYVENFDVRGRGSRYTLEMITVDGDKTSATFVPANNRRSRGRR